MYLSGNNMLSLKNTKIANKLLIAFGLFVCSMLVTCFISIKSSNDMAAVTKKLYNHPLAVSKAVKDIQLQIQIIHSNMKEIAIIDNQADLNKIRKVVDESEEKALNAFAVLEDRFLGDMKSIEDTKKSFIQWRKLRDREFVLAAEGRYDEVAFLARGQAVNYIVLLEEKIDYVVDFATQKGSEFYNKSVTYKEIQLRNLVIVFFISILFSSIIAFLISISITRPLKNTVNALKKLANGNMNFSFSTDRKDELGELQNTTESLRKVLEGIDQVAHEISLGNLDVNIAQRSQDDKLVDSLNTMIHELNNIANFADEVSKGNLSITTEKKSEKDSLADSLNSMAINLANSQEKLIKSEKMVMLGSLISGIAHEINTPLAAIQSSATVISNSYNYIINSIRKITRLVSQYQDFFDSNLINACTCSNTHVSSRDKRIQRNNIIKELDTYNIPESREVASLIIETGLAENYKDHLDIITSEDCMEILQTLRYYSDINKSIEIIDTAVGKTSKIIEALRNYIYQKNNDEKTTANLASNIDSVLTLYQNKLKHKPELKLNLDYDTELQIMCLPGKLNQVWTNLINNALYAMGDQGTLTISTYQEDDFAVVKVSDSGCGIPVEIQGKVFEPLYTTKPQGEGTGLGLDICKNIIKEHNGEIILKSEPGKGTTFIIKLPLAAVPACEMACHA